MFSFRYLVTCLELYHIFNQVSEKTLRRFQQYERVYKIGLVACFILGPFQYNDYTVFQTMPFATTLFMSTAIVNCITQLAMVVMTTVSLKKINSFIRCYPQMDINNTSSIIQYSLLLSLAIMNVIIISTMIVLFRTYGLVFSMPVIKLLFVVQVVV